MDDVVLLTADIVEGVGEFGSFTIKSRLLMRLLNAKEKLGNDWEISLVRHYPFFNTKTGRSCISVACQSLSSSKNVIVDNIECVVVAMEKMRGIHYSSHSFYGVAPLIYDGGYMSIRGRLFTRFIEAYQVLGQQWRGAIKAVDPFFSTEKGKDFIISVSQLMSTRKRISVDRLERVVVTMEKAAGIAVTSAV